MMVWIVLAGVVAMAVWYLFVQHQQPKQSHNVPRETLPPGAVGWPFLGEIISFYFRTPDFVKQRRGRYGNLFRTFLIGYPMVISTDPEVNKFILNNDGRLFVPAYPSHWSQIIGECNIFVARGDFHKRMRGAFLHFISISVVKNRLLSEIQNIITFSLAGWEGRNVNVLHEAEEMIFSVMANHMLSLSAGTALESMKRDFLVMMKGLRSLPLRVPGTTFYKSLQKKQVLFNQIKSIIEERKLNMSAYDSYDDLLSSILKSASEKEFTTTQIVDLIVQSVIGSLETTPKIMASVVRHLSENPHIIIYLKEEHETIIQAKENNQSLSWDDYKSMVFTKSVIKETLRFGMQPLNNIMFKKTLQDVKIEGYTIPKGWTCIIYDLVSDMDTKYCKDPLSFNPQRWQSKEMNEVPFLAFGGGPRLCPGYELAMLTMSFFLHHLVTKFRWEYLPSKSELRWFDSPLNSVFDCRIHVENR